jgi:hypothetical protein
MRSSRSSKRGRSFQFEIRTTQRGLDPVKKEVFFFPQFEVRTSCKKGQSHKVMMSFSALFHKDYYGFYMHSGPP